MASPQIPTARTDPRYDHITVRLQYRHDGQWHFSQAREWNKLGFNFFAEHVLTDDPQAFKRGLTHFDGQIVWRTQQASDEAVLGQLVNELIFKRAQQLGTEASLQSRLLKLMRVDGMVSDKRRILASLGLDIGDNKWDELVARRKQERPLHHYGVRVDCAAWQAVVEQALSLSSVVLTMEQWSRSLKDLPAQVVAQSAK